MIVRKLLAAGLCAILTGGAAAARDLTVVSRGDALQADQSNAYVTPWSAATGQPVDRKVWAGGIDILRARTPSAAGSWDLVEVSPGELSIGCDEGLFEKLAWPAIGGRDHYLPIAVGDCGVGAGVHSIVLAWDRDKFAASPSWSDFWDVARYPGKRGLRRAARSNLEIALMADGVAPGDVYRALRSDDGVDRAFRKLDQIKPYVSWWGPPAQAAQMLSSGDVLLTSADNVAITTANRRDSRHFGLQWGGSLNEVLSWVVMKGSPFLADALKLLAFAGDASRQAIFASDLPYGPTARGATDQLAPDVLAVSPTAPANLADALEVDEQFWRDNGEKLQLRFETWLAH